MGVINGVVRAKKNCGGERGKEGRTNERHGTDHVTSEPMRALKKFAPDGAERSHTGMATL